MSEWNTYPLGELTNWFSGGTPSKSNPAFWNGEIPWVSAKSMTNYKVSQSDLNISKDGLDDGSRLAATNDILLLVRGSGLFNDIPICLVDKPVAFNQDIKAIRAKNPADQKYIYFWLYSSKKELYDILDETGIGAGKFDTPLLQEMKVPFPRDKEYRRVLVSTAESIFDKIDLLHRQNKTLEAIAETMFRQWFVEEAQEDWEEKSLLDLIELVGGGTPKTSMSEYWDGDIPWLSGGDIATNHKGFASISEKTITKAGLENSSAKLLPKFATVISARGTVGKYCLLASEMAFSQSNYGILPRIKDCYFFTYLLVNHVVEELQSAAYGSVFDTITTSTFREAKFAAPPVAKVLEFEDFIASYFDKKLVNQTQIRTLEKLRNNLLPKLMSGEVRVA